MNAVAPHMLVYPTDAPEFELSRLEWAAGRADDRAIDHAGPQVLICTDGAVELCRPGPAAN